MRVSDEAGEAGSISGDDTNLAPEERHSCTKLLQPDLNIVLPKQYSAIQLLTPADKRAVCSLSVC